MKDIVCILFDILAPLATCLRETGYIIYILLWESLTF